MLMLDLLTDYKSLHHCHARRAAVNNTGIPLGEKGDRLHSAGAVYSVKSALSDADISPVFKAPIL